jgi:broad specificity phosphatase PhoE
MSRPPILFVRHGETDWNREARLQGQREVHLNALGRRQAARNGRVLAALIEPQEWRFAASPLARAGDTMRLILAALGRPADAFATDRRLMELTYGAWEGMTLGEIADGDAAAVAAREAGKWAFLPPGGESYAMLAERIGDWLAAVDAPVVVVAHGGVMRVLLHLVAGLPPEAAAHRPAPQDRVVLFRPGMAAVL